MTQLALSTTLPTREQVNPDSTLRLDRQQIITGQLEREYQNLMDALNFKLSFSLKLKQVTSNLQSSQYLRTASIKEDPNIRIKHYIAASIQSNHQKIGQQATDKKDNKKCKQSQHLKQLFDVKSIEQEQIELKKLQHKKEKLYEQIQAQLQKQEPYISEKIMIRIKKEARRNSKLKSITFIQKQISNNQKWLEEKQQKVSMQQQKKQMQSKVMILLQQMKEVMNKKANNNDLIYDQYITDSDHLQRNLQEIQNISSKVKADYLDKIKCITELTTIQKHHHLQKRKPYKSQKTLVHQQVKNFFEDVDKIMQCLTYSKQNDLEEKLQIVKGRLNEIENMSLC